MTEENLNILQECALFKGIEKMELPALLQCLAASEKNYPKEEVIFAAGSAPQSVGVVLVGSVYVAQNDYWGNRSILAQLGPGEIFGEAFSYAGVKNLPVQVHAVQSAAILLMNHQKIVNSCPSGCGYHARLIQNMLGVLAQKNVVLTWKMETIAQRTTRAKLLAYLSGEAQKQRKTSFLIPFNRQELADYLAVDRSAMSVELSKMQKEGLIIFQKNAFTLM